MRIFKANKNRILNWLHDHNDSCVDAEVQACNIPFLVWVELLVESRVETWMSKTIIEIHEGHTRSMYPICLLETEVLYDLFPFSLLEIGMTSSFLTLLLPTIPTIAIASWIFLMVWVIPIIIIASWISMMRWQKR